MLDKNVKIGVVYKDTDNGSEHVISGEASILPLNEISKKDMGLQLAMDIATRHAGHARISIKNYTVEEL